MRKKIPEKPSGFSLVEFLIAMAVFALFTISLCAQFARHMKTFSREKERIDTQQKVRSVLNWLEEDIRLAGFDPLALPSSHIGVEVAEAGHFAFSYRVDQDGDGLWSEEDWKRIDYYTEDDERLRRRERNRPDSTGATSILLDRASLNFLYLDRNHEVLKVVTPQEYGNIRAIRIEIKASFRDSTMKDGTVAFATTVQCRNLGGKT